MKGQYNHSVGNDARKLTVRKESSRGSAFRTTAACLGAVAVAMYTPVMVDKYFDIKDRAAMADNSCAYKEVVADDISSYQRWAGEAIKESNDLGERVGVTRLEGILYKDNKGKDVIPGGKYQVPNCQSD